MNGSAGTTATDALTDGGGSAAVSASGVEGTSSTSQTKATGLRISSSSDRFLEGASGGVHLLIFARDSRFTTYTYAGIRAGFLLESELVYGR